MKQAVRDPEARLRILYYFTKSYNREWDVQKHTYVVSKERTKLRYYEEFRNLQDAEQDKENGVRKEDLPAIPPDMLGRGRVLHIAVNRTMEQAFGVPEIVRTIRWLTAYNDLMRARVDMAKAAASIIMRRKLKGGGAAMQQHASQALMQANTVPRAPVDPATMGQAPQARERDRGDAGRADDPLAVQRRHRLAAALPRRPLDYEPRHGDLAGAEGAQDGRKRASRCSTTQ